MLFSASTALVTSFFFLVATAASTSSADSRPKDLCAKANTSLLTQKVPVSCATSPIDTACPLKKPLIGATAPLSTDVHIASPVCTRPAAFVVALDAALVVAAAAAVVAAAVVSASVVAASVVAA